jgi:hypothetical protein
LIRIINFLFVAGFIREKQLVSLLILFTRLLSHADAGNVEKSILLFGLFDKKCISQYDLYCQPDIWPEVLATLSGFFIGQTRVPALPVAVICLL